MMQLSQDIKERIETYLVDEMGEDSAIIISMLIAKVCRHTDIKEEFLRWLKTRAYSADRPVVVEGYTAKGIAQIAPELDGIGVYNLLADLRDNPQQTRQYIDERFPIA